MPRTLRVPSVTGDTQPTSGTVLVDGQEVAGGRKALKAVRRRIQPVFQNPYASLDPRTPIGDSIGEGLRIHRLGTPAERTEPEGEAVPKKGSAVNGSKTEFYASTPITQLLDAGVCFVGPVGLEAA